MQKVIDRKNIDETKPNPKKDFSAWYKPVDPPECHQHPRLNNVLFIFKPFSKCWKKKKRGKLLCCSVEKASAGGHCLFLTHSLDAVALMFPRWCLHNCSRVYFSLAETSDAVGGRAPPELATPLAAPAVLHNHPEVNLSWRQREARAWRLFSIMSGRHQRSRRIC